MKISITEYGVVRVFDDLEDYAELKLDGDDYERERGAIEAAAATAANNSKAIGRLLDVFAGKGLLSASEVVNVLDDSYSSPDAEFI